MKRAICFGLILVLLLATMGFALAAEEEEKAWDELYAEGCRAFSEGDMEKAMEAFTASLESADDAEVVPALMRYACAVPRAAGKSWVTISLPELEQNIAKVEAMADEMGELYAQKKISKKVYEQLREWIMLVRQYLAEYQTALREVDEQTREQTNSLNSPLTGGATLLASQDAFDAALPLPIFSLREHLEKPKAPSAYREQVTSTKQDEHYTRFLDKDGHLLRLEWDDEYGIHGVQHYINDANGYPMYAFTYWNGVLICSFSFYRLEGSYVSTKWFDQAAIQKVFQAMGHR